MGHPAQIDGVLPIEVRMSVIRQMTTGARVPRTGRCVVEAVLIGLLLGGCAVREKQRAERAALEYIERTKRWRPDQFRLEHHGWTDDGRQAIVYAVFLEDERPRPYLGGGESVALYIDRQDHRVVRELHFQ